MATLEYGIKISSSLEKLFKDYASYHRSRGNRFLHYFGIPMIALALLGLLARAHSGGEPAASEILRPDLGLALWAAAVLWYLFLDWKIAVPFSLFAIGLYFLGRACPVPALWALFVAGWILQFIGHYAYEKKSPAFFKNLGHLLVGPLWVFAKTVGYFNPDSSEKRKS